MKKLFTTLLGASALLCSTFAIAEEHLRHNPETMFDTSVIGYTQMVSSKNTGQTIYVSGQTATDIDGNAVGKDVAEQMPVVFENLRKVIEAAGAKPEHVTKINVYFVEPYTPSYLPLLREEINKLFGKEHLPANTLLVVSQLAVPDYLFEVDAVIVKP